MLLTGRVEYAYACQIDGSTISYLARALTGAHESKSQDGGANQRCNPMSLRLRRPSPDQDTDREHDHSSLSDNQAVLWLAVVVETSTAVFVNSIGKVRRKGCS